MKKGLSLILAILLMGTLAACGGTADSTAESAAATSGSAAGEGGEEAAAEGGDVQIGILIPGSPTDGGFSQSAAEAGRYLEETYGFSVAVVEAGTSEVIKQEGEIMGEDGYDVVFGHGGQCAAPFAEFVADYPDTMFYTVGGDIVAENQIPLILCLEEATYIAGVVTAMMDDMDTIGITLGGDFPAYTKTTTGWALGAHSVNPDIEILQAVLSSPDANEAYETTLNQIQNGAGAILSNSNEGQAGALKAVSESEGVYAIGCLGDFTSQAPEQVIINTFGDYTTMYSDATQRALADDMPAETQFYTLETGAVYYEWNDAVRDTLPEEIIAAAEETEAAIIAGEIDVPNEFEQDAAEATLAGE